jgi:hypothetical protein
VRHVADLLLRAAWCCVDEADTEAERFFRRKAAWKFEEALSSYDGVAREERAVLTYLVGELWRRVGDVRQATAWFDRVSGEITEVATQQWVQDAARQQRDCADKAHRRRAGVPLTFPGFPFSRTASSCSEQPIASVAEARQDVALIVELAIERRTVHDDVRMC